MANYAIPPAGSAASSSVANVVVTVTDPARLIAGTSDYLPYAAVSIKLYRYTTEALARADVTGSGGSLVTTFTLVATTTAASDPNISGPYRFGYYDASQTAASWYRYLFADATSANLSQLSEPWQADDRDQTQLRDILYEVGRLMGGSVQKLTATAGSTTTVVARDLSSTKLDSRFYEGYYAYVTQDAGGTGAAPENEEAMVASYAPTTSSTTGTITLDRTLTAAIAVGDIVLLSVYIRPSEMIAIINRTREKMQLVQTIDIALSDQEDRYPAPPGVKSDTDILEAYGVYQIAGGGTTDTNYRERVFPIDVRLVSDGFRQWIETEETTGSTKLIRLRVLRSYRDIEGPLSAMSDTTSCPIEWWRPAFAYAVAQWLVESDESDPEYQRLLAQFKDEAAMASGRFAPDIQRRARKGNGRRIVPGPAWTP